MYAPNPLTHHDLNQQPPSSRKRCSTSFLKSADVSDGSRDFMLIAANFCWLFPVLADILSSPAWVFLQEIPLYLHTVNEKSVPPSKCNLPLSHTIDLFIKRQDGDSSRTPPLSSPPSLRKQEMKYPIFQ